MTKKSDAQHLACRKPVRLASAGGQHRVGSGKNGCLDGKYPKACEKFCDCIYNQGEPLDKCLEEYKLAKEREKNDSLSTTNNK